MLNLELKFDPTETRYCRRTVQGGEARGKRWGRQKLVPMKRKHPELAKEQTPVLIPINLAK